MFIGWTSIKVYCDQIQFVQRRTLQMPKATQETKPYACFIHKLVFATILTIQSRNP